MSPRWPGPPRPIRGPEWNGARSFEILGQVLDIVGDLFEELRILAQQDVVVSTQCIGLLAVHPAVTISVLLSQLLGYGKEIQVCVGDMDNPTVAPSNIKTCNSGHS